MQKCRPAATALTVARSSATRAARKATRPHAHTPTRHIISSSTDAPQPQDFGGTRPVSCTGSSLPAFFVGFSRFLDWPLRA